MWDDIEYSGGDDALNYGYDMPNLDSSMFADLSGLGMSEEAINNLLQDQPSGYYDVYGGVESVLPGNIEYSPDQIAAMQDQDQLWSMGAKGVFTDDTEPGSSGGTRGSYREAGPGQLGSYKGASYMPGGARVDAKGNVRLPTGKTVSPGGKVTNTPNLIQQLLPLLMMAMAMRKGGGGAGATIPALTAVQKQTPYRDIQRAPGYRPGQGGVSYFDPVQYLPRLGLAGGGVVDLARVMAAQRMARGGRPAGGQLLQGNGDGVSDSIPATIDGERPARLARGEYVVDARTVAELGNGSTDAGAERLDEMRRRVHAKRKKAKVGTDSKAYNDLPA